MREHNKGAVSLCQVSDQGIFIISGCIPCHGQTRTSESCVDGRSDLNQAQAVGSPERAGGKR